MAEIIDLVAELKKKAWKRQQHKQVIDHCLFVAMLTQAVADDVADVVSEADSSAPIMDLLPIFALSDFAIYARDTVKDLLEKLVNATEISEQDDLAILIAGARYKEVHIMFRELSGKQDLYDGIDL